MTNDVKIYKKVFLVWLLLLLPPLAIFLLKQSVFPWIDLSSSWSYILYAITMTGTSPYFVATILFIFGLSYFCVPKQVWLRLVLATVVSLSLSTSLNVLLKQYFKEPRPNMVFLSEQENLPLNLDSFYDLNRQERAEMMDQTMQAYSDSTPLERDSVDLAHQNKQIFELLQDHWRHEVGYSFPSGHTIFSATLVITASYYLLLCGARLLLGGMLVWGIAMGVSRMLLGMHWPQDVLASTALSILFSLLGIVVSNYYYARKGDSRA